jgi:hypothetical protein
MEKRAKYGKKGKGHRRTAAPERAPAQSANELASDGLRTAWELEYVRVGSAGRFDRRMTPLSWCAGRFSPRKDANRPGPVVTQCVVVVLPKGLPRAGNAPFLLTRALHSVLADLRAVKLRQRIHNARTLALHRIKCEVRVPDVALAWHCTI